MTDTSVNYSFEDGVATIRIDDGKRNALAPAVLRDIYAALDKAEQDKAIVIITGREEVLSAGFDLKVMRGGPRNALNMLRLGYALPARVMSYPYPVIVACPGHVLAMGVFLMLSADYVVGTEGDFKISANEVAIGMTMPRVAAATLRHRLEPAAFQRAVTTAEFFDPDGALAAGFFDEIVRAEDLEARANGLAEQFKALDETAHRVSKRRIRKKTIRYIRWARHLDLIDAALVGLQR